MGKLPVLMIVFNRKSTAGKVLEAIRRYQPEQLYVAADGPRSDHPADIAKCEAVRQLFDKIDWPCRLHTRFLPENHGCRLAPSEAISWFFEQEEEGIILEDDCLPSPDFFRFAEDMLALYRNEPRLMVIGGSCYFDQPVSKASYEFSRFMLTWGWASRRSAWAKFDLEMKDFPEFMQSGKIRNLLPGHPFMQWRLLRVFRKCFEKSPYFYDVWDWMFFYAILKNEGLCIHPNCNLVTNIGDQDPTHVMDHSAVHRPLETLPPVLVHPEKLEPNQQNDLRIFRKIHSGDWKDRIRFGLSKITGKDWM